MDCWADVGLDVW